MFSPVMPAEVARTLVGNILYVDFEDQRIRRADCDTGRTVITFLAEPVAHRVKLKLAYRGAFRTVVAGIHLALYA